MLRPEPPKDRHADTRMADGFAECAIGIPDGSDPDGAALALAEFLRARDCGGYVRTAVGFSPDFLEECLILTSSRCDGGKDPLPVIAAYLRATAQPCAHMLHNGAAYCLRADGAVRRLT